MMLDEFSCLDSYGSNLGEEFHLKKRLSNKNHETRMLSISFQPILPAIDPLTL